MSLGAFNVGFLSFVQKESDVPRTDYLWKDTQELGPGAASGEESRGAVREMELLPLH